MYYHLLCTILILVFFFFFFNDTATTEIYTLSLHDALPIFVGEPGVGTTRLVEELCAQVSPCASVASTSYPAYGSLGGRSEEHTSELQSRQYLVCRLLLEKKKKKNNIINLIKYYDIHHNRLK